MTEPDESTRLAYLAALGIDAFQPRRQPAAATRETAGGDAASSDPAFAWRDLEQRVARCTLCRLHETRTQPVFGVGARSASLMIIGEAPGAEEDRTGEPFVGRAGQLLNAMLRAIGLAREQVFIANTIKCRPPNNRDPRSDEVSACEDYLTRQIDLLAPRVILAVGRVAAQRLLQVDLPLGRMRGRTHELADRKTPLVVTYHPAYLLRTPAQKVRAWEDLKRVRALLSPSE